MGAVSDAQIRGVSTRYRGACHGPAVLHGYPAFQSHASYTGVGRPRYKDTGSVLPFLQSSPWAQACAVQLGLTTFCKSSLAPYQSSSLMALL